MAEKTVSAKSNLSLPPNKLRVFLCHSSADKPIARELFGRLNANNIHVWFDEESLLPGQDWRREIVKAVRNSDAVIVCLSHNSIHKRGYVQSEIRVALDVADEQPDETIYIIPPRLEECEIPERLNRWQWVDYFEPRGYDKLIRALNERARSLDTDDSAY